MMSQKKKIGAIVLNIFHRLPQACLIAGLILWAIPTNASDLPAATKKTLGDLNISPDVMQGLDKELDVPKEWIDGANREGLVKVSGSWTAEQFTSLNAAFRERYPAIKLDYSVGTFNARAIRPLVAFKEGRYIIDIMTGFGGSVHFYQEANALEDLRSLPGFKNPIAGTGDPDGGTWVAMRLRYWCVSYNTNKVNKSDLPKTWGDLLTNSVWRNGNVGVGDRPQLWLLMLWKANGDTWTTEYIDKFFSVLKPQLRKEGMNALISLNGLGEFNMALPAADFATKQAVDKNVPVGWHCPEPIPIAVSQMGILKGNPHINAAKIWANWFLSKEGQIAQYAADQSPPVHRDLQTSDFIAFPDEIKNKKMAPATEEDIDALYDVWNKHWESAGGKK
jgi:iron(III) transport system substrate-binding protein